MKNSDDFTSEHCKIYTILRQEVAIKMYYILVPKNAPRAPVKLGYKIT